MTSAPYLHRVLVYGGFVALAVGVVAGVSGALAAGIPGLIGGLMGAVLAALFLGLTAVSMLVAGRATKGDPGSPTFYVIVMAAWVVKLIVFVVVLIWLRYQTWLDPFVFFMAVIAAVVGSLVADVVAMLRSRIPYVSDIDLPGNNP